VAGAPGERRRYLDIVLSLGVRGYLQAAQRYRQVLRQRNALLKRGASLTAMGPWDDALAEWGAKLMVLRARWVAGHAEAFGRRYEAIGGNAAAALAYRPGVRLGDADPTDEAAVAEAFVAEIRRIVPREQERGTTLSGPHRDDLALAVAGGEGAIELREFGSGGQMRTAAIALRLIEADTIRETRGRAPLILLDDVFAELDPGRSRRILEMLDTAERGQVILTAPKESDVALQEAGFASLARWRIAAGRVST